MYRAKPILSLLETKRQLRLDGSKDDAALLRTIQAVSSGIEEYCRRTFAEQANITEYYGFRSAESQLWTRHRPITDTTSRVLYIDALRQWSSSALMVEDNGGSILADFVIERDIGLITMIGGTAFVRGPKTAKLTYSFGYLPAQRQWLPSFGYLAGALVVPNGAPSTLWKVTTAGTSGTTEPAWPVDAQIGAVIVDNGATWTCQGEATGTIPAMVFEAAVWWAGYIMQRLNDKQALVIGSKSSPEGNVNFVSGMPKDVKDMLQPFVFSGFAGGGNEAAPGGWLP